MWNTIIDNLEYLTWDEEESVVIKNNQISYSSSKENNPVDLTQEQSEEYAKTVLTYLDSPNLKLSDELSINLIELIETNEKFNKKEISSLEYICASSPKAE